MDTTKIVDIEGNKFTIRRLKLRDRKVLEKIPSDSIDYQIQSIFLSTVEPKFDSPDDVQNLDEIISSQLIMEITEFNLPSQAFLDKSRRLSEQVQLLNPSLGRQMTSGEST